MAKKKSMQKTVAEGEAGSKETSGSGELGKQLDLIKVGPEHTEEIENATDRWKALIKRRLSIQAREAEAKAELLALIAAENLTRLPNGSIKCRCEGWLIELTPTAEKLKATRI